MNELNEYREMSNEWLWEVFLGNSVLPETATDEEIEENVRGWGHDEIVAAYVIGRLTEFAKGFRAIMGLE